MAISNKRIRIGNKTERLLNAVNRDIEKIEVKLNRKLGKYRKVGVGISNDRIIYHALKSMVDGEDGIPETQELEEALEQIRNEELQELHDKKQEEEEQG